MNFKEKWKRSRPIAKALFVLIILYIVVSVYILLSGLGIVDNILTEDNNAMLVYFSIISFGLTTILAVFHLYTLIARRKRDADKIADMGMKNTNNDERAVRE